MIAKLKDVTQTREGLPWKETDEITIKICKKTRKREYHTGYIRDRVKELAYRTLFLNNEEVRFIAYSKKDKKAVGSVRARKISELLWGAWDIFVTEAYRGRRIASLLLEEMTRHLKEKGAMKLVSIVDRNNIFSISHSRRSGWKLLRNGILICVRTGRLVEPFPEGIIVRKLRQGEESRLFNIFELCVGKEWVDYLEINPRNFLSRIYGPAFFEEYGLLARALLSKVATSKEIVVAESKGELRAYMISLTGRFFNTDNYALLFVPISNDFEALSTSLLLNVFSHPTYKGQNRFIFLYTGESRHREHIQKLGFEIQELLVQYLLL